jgi:carboxymethylenebutenolidase
MTRSHASILGGLTTGTVEVLATVARSRSLAFALLRAAAVKDLEAVDDPGALPTMEPHEGVLAERVMLDLRGESCPTLLFRPSDTGRHPAVVIGQEATGPNEFIRRVAATLAQMGFVAVVPDYYHGQGPPDPEAYEDLDTLIRYIDALDFRRGAYDLMAALDYAKSRPEVDDQRLGLWAYCTGATLGLIAGCLRGDVTATVLFYPSQPRFDAITATKPAHAIDLVWNLTSAVLLLVGEDDFVWPPELLDEVRGRFTQWGVEHTIKTYPGAGHAFCSPAPTFYNAAAEHAAWTDATGFLSSLLQ